MSEQRGVPPDVEAKLFQLERLVGEAKTVPLSASVMLNRSELDGLVADLRTRAAAEDSSIATEPRRIDSKGRAALLVADESLEGTAATLVILDETGRVLCKMPTTVGGDV